MIVVFSVITGLATYLWLVCTGRKPLLVKFPSRLKEADLWQRCSALIYQTRHKLDGEGDGQFKARSLYWTNANIVTREIAVEYPFAAMICSSEAGSLWFEESHHTDPTKFGSKLTIGVRARMSPFQLFRVAVRALMVAVRLGWPHARNQGAEGTGSPWQESQRTEFKHTYKRKQKFVPKQFLREHSYEIGLSLIACASFATTFGFDGMLLLTPIILLHEYGHLLGYQLTGKVGNKMMLVPFFGGIAVAGSEHKSEFDAAFCAIMGPAICVPLSIALTAATFLVGEHGSWWWFCYAAFLCSSMNALNLLPMLPLDGGHAFQSIARSIAPSQTSPAMFVLTLAGAVLLQYSGYESIASVVGLWGLMQVAQQWNVPSYATPLTGKSGIIIAIFHLGTFAVHAACGFIIWFWFY